jgi:hypothetical protein
VGAGEPADARDAPGGAGQPGKDVSGGGGRARLLRGNGQFDQGDQPPVRAGPFAVGVDAEPAAALLAGKQRGHLGAGQHLAGVVICPLTEEVAAGHQPDSRLTGSQQPGHRGARPRIHTRTCPLQAIALIIADLTGPHQASHTQQHDPVNQHKEPARPIRAGGSVGQG